MLAIARSHVMSLGGNCLVGYSLERCLIQENSYKNQVYCLIHITGDVMVGRRDVGSINPIWS